jgi:hypothetical protein
MGFVQQVLGGPNPIASIAKLGCGFLNPHRRITEYFPRISDNMIKSGLSLWENIQHFERWQRRSLKTSDSGGKEEYDTIAALQKPTMCVLIFVNA